MAVSEGDVRHIAHLARLGLDPERIAALARELNGILEHMDALTAADTSQAHDAERLPRGIRLRADDASPDPLLRPIDAFAPRTEGGFFLVPRLATHEDAEDGGGA